MEREIMELDFFPLPHTFRGIPISKIKPHLLKSLIVNSNLPPNYTPSPTTHIVRQPTTSENEDSSPMTIFYNGSVAVYHLPPYKAEEILKLVEEGRVEAANPIPSTQHQHLMLPSLTLNGDLPIARKKSLQRFLEKRKERMITASPYIYG